MRVRFPSPAPHARRPMPQGIPWSRSATWPRRSTTSRARSSAVWLISVARMLEWPIRCAPRSRPAETSSPVGGVVEAEVFGGRGAGAPDEAELVAFGVSHDPPAVAGVDVVGGRRRGEGRWRSPGPWHREAHAGPGAGGSSPASHRGRGRSPIAPDRREARRCRTGPGGAHRREGTARLPEPDRIRTVERHRVDHRHGMVRPFSAGLPHGFVGHRSSLVKGQVGAPDACSGCGCRRHRTWIPVGRVRSARGQAIAPTGTASPSGRPRQPCRRLTAKLVMRVLFPSPAPHSKSPQQKGIPSLDIPCARNRLRPACN